MPSEFNKGKALRLYESLHGKHEQRALITLLVRIVGFLLARYIHGE